MIQQQRQNEPGCGDSLLAGRVAFVRSRGALGILQINANTSLGVFDLKKKQMAAFAITSLKCCIAVNKNQGIWY